MKSNAIARIILYSLLALVLLVLLIGGIILGHFEFAWSIGSGGTEVETEAAFDADDIHKIEIDWAAGSVEIQTADTDQITVSERRPEDTKYKLAYKLSGGTLQLDYSSYTVGIGFGSLSMPSKDLILTVPADWVCRELEIDGASLEISIKNLTVNTLDLDGAACSLDFNGSLDKLEADGASADLKLHCVNKIAEISIDGASCNLELTLPAGCGFRAEMDGLSCSFHSKLHHTTHHDTYCYGDEHCRMDISGVSCTVTVKEG